MVFPLENDDELVKGRIFATSVFRGAIFVDAEWQKLGASASNSLPFLTHPRKSLFPPKSTISLKINLLPVSSGFGLIKNKLTNRTEIF
jgi:hypothetical protein